MHPTQLSCSLGDFAGNVPEATLGIVGANFHYETKEMSGITICYNSNLFLKISVKLNQSGISTIIVSTSTVKRPFPLSGVFPTPAP